MKWDRKAGGRSTPADLEQSKPAASVEFNYTKLIHGWPKHEGKTFGPTQIHKALAAGYFVLARINEAPVEVTVTKARLVNGALQCLVSEGWRFPLSVRTINPANMRGIKL